MDIPARHMYCLSPGNCKLTADQHQQTEALFRQMEAKAIAAGRRLIDEEIRLDRHFADRTISPELLVQSLRQIGELQALIRQVHLETHLAQTAILSLEQVSHYAELRGYSAEARASGNAVPQKHH